MAATTQKLSFEEYLAYSDGTDARYVWTSLDCATTGLSAPPTLAVSNEPNGMQDTKTRTLALSIWK